MSLRFFVLACLVSLSLPSWAEVSIHESAYSAQLDGDWVQVACTTEDQVSLISKSLNAQVRIQHFDNLKLKPEALERIARGVIELGIKQEPGNSMGRPFYITGRSVEQIAGGYRANYSGRDETKRSFKYVGLVFQTKALNIYVEMPSAFETDLESVVNSVIERVRY
ncbi:MAG: hypothetical protein ACYC1F_02945 [Gallionellaceae bacterium]